MKKCRIIFSVDFKSFFINEYWFCYSEPCQSSWHHYFYRLSIRLMRKYFIRNIFLSTLKINTIILTVYWKLQQKITFILKNCALNHYWIYFKFFKQAASTFYSSFLSGIIHVRHFETFELFYSFSFDHSPYRKLWSL